MTLKIVKGLIESRAQGDTARPAATTRSDGSNPVNQAQQQTTAVMRATQSAAAATAQSSEAVISSVKVAASKATGGAERVREYREAKDVAGRVSDEIRRDPESAKGAYDGLSTTGPRSDLAQ